MAQLIPKHQTGSPIQWIKPATVDALQKSFQESQQQEVTREQRIQQIKSGSPWNINDYKKHGLSEPGLESPPVDPIDLVMGGLGVKASIGAYNALKATKNVAPVLLNGTLVNVVRPKSVAKASALFGKALGYSTADAVGMLGGTDNNYTSSK